MSSHVFVDKNVRVLIDARADHEKGRIDLLLFQVLKQITKKSGVCLGGDKPVKKILTELKRGGK
jgi:hypothetical protein